MENVAVGRCGSDTLLIGGVWGGVDVLTAFNTFAGGIALIAF